MRRDDQWVSQIPPRFYLATLLTAGFAGFVGTRLIPGHLEPTIYAVVIVMLQVRTCRSVLQRSDIQTLLVLEIVAHIALVCLTTDQTWAFGGFMVPAGLADYLLFWLVADRLVRRSV